MRTPHLWRKDSVCKNLSLEIFPIDPPSGVHADYRTDTAQYPSRHESNLVTDPPSDPPAYKHSDAYQQFIHGAPEQSQAKENRVACQPGRFLAACVRGKPACGGQAFL